MGSSQSKKSNKDLRSKFSKNTAVRSSRSTFPSIIPHSSGGQSSEKNVELKKGKIQNKLKRFSLRGKMANQDLVKEEKDSTEFIPPNSSTHINEERMRNGLEDSSGKNGRRRRTRSSAGFEATDRDDHDPTSSETRRLRRRKDESNVTGLNQISNKGKERSHSVCDGKEEVGDKEIGVDEMQIDQTNFIESRNANMQTESQFPHASSSNTVMVDAQMNTDDDRSLNVSNDSSINDPMLANNTTTESNERLRRDIERSIGTNDVTQRILAQQNANVENAHPSMLSALLSDILGLRGARAGQEGAAATTSGNSSNGNTQSNTNNSRSGGTSVIVQGALVSRTVPTNRQASNRTGEQNGQRNASSSQANAEPATNSGSPLPSVPLGHPVNPSSIPSLNGEAQAATIEEQASMLVRLLSIATAATAASLLSNPNARGNVAATARDSMANADQAAGGGISSVLSRPAARPMTPNPSPSTAPSQISTSPSNTSIPNDVPSSSTSSITAQAPNARSAWATQTFQSLRSRISSFGNRLRGRSVTFADSDTVIRPSRSASESNVNMSNIRRAIVAAQREHNHRVDQMGPPPQPSTDGRVEDEQPTLASLSNMLRDAIRESLSNVGRSSSTPAPSQSNDRPRSSTSESHQNANNASDSSNTDANDARSRSRAVQATLEAVREGQLSPGEEGSFNRFLFDLSNDLNVAVRGMPSGVEDQEDRDHAVPEVGAEQNLNNLGGTLTDSETTSSSTDEVTQQRRRSDIRDGQLSFFRFFTFPEQRNVQQTVSGIDSTPSTLLPCIVVGVRSLEANEMPGADTLAGTASRDMNQELNQNEQVNGAQATETVLNNPATNPVQHTNHRSGLEALLPVSTNSPPMSRFLLFVSGGHYPPQHPLFHASNDEASRDLMVLMEFLGAMAAVQIKSNNTVTSDQIAKSNLRSVNGNLTEIEALTKLNQIMENTSERCLICLEDWQEEGDERRLLDCGHLFHSTCIDQWLTSSNNSCPLCRRQAVTINGGGE